MNQRELVKIISKKTGLTQQQSFYCIKAVMETIVESLRNQENVFLRGFGSFMIKERKEKRLRAVGSKHIIEIPGKKIVKFYNNILPDEKF